MPGDPPDWALDPDAAPGLASSPRHSQTFEDHVANVKPALRTVQDAQCLSVLTKPSVQIAQAKERQELSLVETAENDEPDPRPASFAQLEVLQSGDGGPEGRVPPEQVEPGGLGAAVGLHLELLGRALRAAQCGSAAAARPADADVAEAWDAKLESSGLAVLRELHQSGIGPPKEQPPQPRPDPKPSPQPQPAAGESLVPQEVPSGRARGRLVTGDVEDEAADAEEEPPDRTVSHSPVKQVYLDRSASNDLDSDLVSVGFADTQPPASNVDSNIIRESSRTSGKQKKRGRGIFSLIDKSRAGARQRRQLKGNHPDIAFSLQRSSTQEGSFAHRLNAFVMHSYFEWFFGVLTAINAFIIILEEQYAGSKAGYEVGFYEHYGSQAYHANFHVVTVGPADVFMYLEFVFAGLFTLEAVLRMGGRRAAYWRDPYELLDFFVVVTSLSSIVMTKYIRTTNVQIFRVLRSAKVLRMVRIIRRLQGLDSLQLMTTALSASGFTLLWAVILLVLMQSIVALFLTSLLRSEYLLLTDESDLDQESRIQLFEYFGTYSRCMLSMFELTLANWPPISRFMTEKLHEGWMIFAIAYKLTFGFAVIGVINAVFVQETFHVANTDDSIMVKRRQRAARTHRRKMEILFNKLDQTGHGKVGRKDFRRVLQDPSIAMWLEAMDINASDANVLFALLDRDGDQAISVDELCEGAARLKGNASSFDVQLAIQALRDQWQRSSRTSACSVRDNSLGYRISASDHIWPSDVGDGHDGTNSRDFP